MTDEPFILREDDAGVTTLTLNRPQSRNSLSLGMLRALRAELAAIGKDDRVAWRLSQAQARHFAQATI